MVVRNRLSVFVYGTAKNGVRQRISGCFNFPASVDKAVRSLSCNNGVEHNTVVTTGRVFHSGRYIHTADGKSMLLIFYGTCTYSDIRENVGKITVVFRIQHFICTGETTFLDGVDVHLTDGNQTGKHIRAFSDPAGEPYPCNLRLLYVAYLYKLSE